MDETPEQVYTQLLRQLASPVGTEPEVLAGLFRDIERMHSMGQITDWQLHNAREAYARLREARRRKSPPGRSTRRRRVSTPAPRWFAIAPGPH